MLAKKQNVRNSNLLKGLAVLETMAAEACQFSLAEVAELTGLDKSHACRLLKSLVGAGYVIRNPRNRQYRIGLRTLELSSSILSKMDVRRVGLAYLRDLSDSLGASTYLGVLYQAKVLTVATEYPAGVFAGEVPGFGSVMDLDDSAMGKVLLAYMRAEDASAILGERHEKLRAELGATIRDGVGMIVTSRGGGARVVGVAAAVKDYQGHVIAALGASTSKAAWDELDQGAFMTAVRNAAESLSFAMGYAAGRLPLASGGQ